MTENTRRQETKDTPIWQEKIYDLLSHYEDGERLLKKAHHWDYPVRLKPESKGQGLPESWVLLVDKVLDILATEKYGIPLNSNKVVMVRPDQMLDVAASNGLPISYNHWSFGKERMKMERGKYLGKIYEMIINADPHLMYCQNGNTAIEQMSIQAHCVGHNNFFKENYMFEGTQPDMILDRLEYQKNFIEAAEEKYGVDTVQDFLTACHALKMNSVDIVKTKNLPEEEGKRLREIFGRVAAEGERFDPYMDIEENLLRFMATFAPHLEDWQREIMSTLADTQQYFAPQMKTKIMNEGWATFWQITLLEDLYDMDLIDDEKLFAKDKLCHHVLLQPEVFHPDHMDKMRFNPYRLGLDIFKDIKRISMEPTEEDKKHFPRMAGNGDWLENMKEAMRDYRDDSFILNYLSPHIVREMRMFTVEDDSERDYMEVSAIHDKDGFDRIRRALAGQFRIADHIPQIKAVAYDFKGDRSLTLRYDLRKGRHLDGKHAMKTLKYMHQLWGHTVKLDVIDKDGELKRHMQFPPTPKGGKGRKNVKPPPGMAGQGYNGP